MAADPLLQALGQNIAFFLIASLYVWIGARRTAGTAAFPGPRPPPTWFKVWLVVIWLVGLILPIVTLLVEGVLRANAALAIALGAYLVMFVAQVATEIFVWKRWRSPIWVIVPCLYLAWRLWQCAWGMGLPGAFDSTLAKLTWSALFGLWVINIGVHFTNIPLTLRCKTSTPPRSNPALPARGTRTRPPCIAATVRHSCEILRNTSTSCAIGYITASPASSSRDSCARDPCVSGWTPPSSRMALVRSPPRRGTTTNVRFRFAAR